MVAAGAFLSYVPFQAGGLATRLPRLCDRGTTDPAERYVQETARPDNGLMVCGQRFDDPRRIGWMWKELGIARTEA